MTTDLNLIRMIAATAVRVSHAWPITLGLGAVQPLEGVVGHRLGTLAVFAFFTIPGFPITASFERSSSLTSFLAARFLRLYPALIVSLLVVGLMIALLISSLGVAGFLNTSYPWEFIARNLALVLGYGVFCLAYVPGGFLRACNRFGGLFLWHVYLRLPRAGADGMAVRPSGAGDEHDAGLSRHVRAFRCCHGI